METQEIQALRATNGGQMPGFRTHGGIDLENWLDNHGERVGGLITEAVRLASDWWTIEDTDWLGCGPRAYQFDKRAREFVLSLREAFGDGWLERVLDEAEAAEGAAD